MLPSFANATVTRLRPTLVDDGHGNLEPDWGAPVTADIPGCSVQPGATAEDNANRSGVLIQWTVYAPPTADVAAGDAVVYSGTRYSVSGEPARWNVGFMDHKVILLTRWEG